MTGWRVALCVVVLSSDGAGARRAGGERGALASASSSGPVLYLLSRGGCSDLAAFDYDDGGEFPGAQGAISCCPDTTDALCISHNLTKGGHYTGAKLAGQFLKALGQARPAAFVLDVGAPSGAWLGWSVIDATGQVFPATIPDQTEPTTPRLLRRVRLPLDNKTFAKHWGGANDGVMHLPFSGFVIQSSGSHSTNTIGQMRFANLSLEFTSIADIPSQAILTLSASTVYAGAVAQQGQDDLVLSLSVQNRLQFTSAPFSTWASIHWNISTPGGQSLSSLLPNSTTALAGWERLKRAAIISTASPGYLPVQLGLQPAKGRTITIWHGAVIRLQTRLPVAPDARTSSGVFGLNNVGAARSASAAAAIGVRTIRGQVIWRYAFDESNQLNDSFAWSLYDATFDAAARYNMSVLLNIFPLPPARFANSSRPALPCNDALHWLEAFAEAAARRYGRHQGHLLGVSVGNEPDGSLWLKGGTGSYEHALPVAEAAGVYASWLRAVKQGVLNAQGADRARTLPFGGLSVSGGEWSLKNLTFVKAVAAVAAPTNDLTLFTGHPYACNRQLGCSGDMFTRAKQWVFPSDTDGDGTLTHKLKRAEAVITEAMGYDANISVWPSEFGWALESDAAPTSLLALGQAAAVSQGLVLMRSLAASPQYGPFYLFAEEEAGLEGGATTGGLASFGLWRTPETVSTASFTYNAGRRYPLPAAAAYATASALLEIPTIPLRLEVARLPNASLGVTWEAFERPMIPSRTNINGYGSASVVLAVWLRTAPNGQAAPGRWTTACIEVRDAAAMVQAVYSGLGQELLPTRRTSALHLELSPLPSYLLFQTHAAIGEFAQLLRDCTLNSATCACVSSDTLTKH